MTVPSNHPEAGAPGTPAQRRLVLAALAFFVASRVAVHLGLTPFFDGDSWKFLGGADALWAGEPLPPLFRDLPTIGGGLHAVPGYAWFMDVVWRLVGHVSLPAVLLAQSLVALAGYLAAADLARRWAGAWTGVALLVVLATAPTLLWLEHLLMPDVLGISLFWGSAWLVVQGNRRLEVPAALAAGVLMVGAVMLRTANDALILPLVALSLVVPRSMTRHLKWGGALVFALALGLAPWLAHNHRVHGVYRLAVSSGRHLYYSALWSDTISRTRLAQELGMPGGDAIAQAPELVTRVWHGLLGEGLTIPDADREMGRRAVAAYRDQNPWTVLRQRSGLLAEFFVESEGSGQRVKPLRSAWDEVLANQQFSPAARRWAEGYFQHRFGAESIAAQAAAVHFNGTVVALLRWWAMILTLDGPLLALLALVALPGLWKVEYPVRAFLTFAAPALAALAAFTIFGLPRYRYQVGLHPFFLATVVVGGPALWTSLRGRMGRGRARTSATAGRGTSC